MKIKIPKCFKLCPFAQGQGCILNNHAYKAVMRDKSDFIVVDVFIDVIELALFGRWGNDYLVRL